MLRTDSYMLEACCALVGKVLSNTFKNGYMFVNRKLERLKTDDESISFETILLDLVFKRYRLERILLINFDRNANKSVQKRFYNDSRVLKVSINSKKSEESNFNKIGVASGIGYNVQIELNDVKNFI